MEKGPLQTSFIYLSQAAHIEEGWIHPLRDVVADVDAQTAAWKPAPDVASIFDVVAHSAPYIGDVLHAFRGTERVKHEDWHDLSDTSDAAWQALRRELVSGIDQLQETIGKFSEEDLISPPPGKENPRWEFIADISIHDAYHAGQIVKLKQLYAAKVGARETANL